MEFTGPSHTTELKRHLASSERGSDSLLSHTYMCHHMLLWQIRAGMAKHACVKALVFCTKVSDKSSSVDSPLSTGASHKDI